MTAAATRLEFVALFSEEEVRSREPYELLCARRAKELGISYGALFCIVRTCGLGRTIAYDPATNELVETSAEGEARIPAGSFEGWAP